VLPLPIREPPEIDQPGESVPGERVGSQHLGDRPDRAAAQVEKLREPVLRVDVAEGEEGIAFALGIDMGHAEPVAIDAYGAIDPRDGEAAGHLGQGDALGDARADGRGVPRAR
jgi:hypothetical protein